MFSVDKLLLLSVLTLALSACMPPEPAKQEQPLETAKKSDKPVTAKAPTRHERGRKIYNFYCYYCHGYSGDARTLSSTYLKPKPRDFTSLSPKKVLRDAMIKAVRDGRLGTAMSAYAEVLTAEKIELVVDFIRKEFMHAKNVNTRYHTIANGWPDHQRHANAFPFATGELALDTPWEQLDARQQNGKRLFLATCISCHDRSRVEDEGPVWEPIAISYPRNNTSLTKPDAITSASVYAKHDIPPQLLRKASGQERRGEKLYQENCAFCHAADGTGRNWIGSFLEPRPRDLTRVNNMQHMTDKHLRTAIRDGLPGTTMPAWKSVLTEDEIQAIIAYISQVFSPLENRNIAQRNKQNP